MRIFTITTALLTVSFASQTFASYDDAQFEADFQKAIKRSLEYHQTGKKHPFNPSTASLLEQRTEEMDQLLHDLPKAQEYVRRGYQTLNQIAADLLQAGPLDRVSIENSMAVARGQLYQDMGLVENINNRINELRELIEGRSPSSESKKPFAQHNKQQQEESDAALAKKLQQQEADLNRQNEAKIQTETLEIAKTELQLTLNEWSQAKGNAVLRNQLSQRADDLRNTIKSLSGSSTNTNDIEKTMVLLEQKRKDWIAAAGNADLRSKLSNEITAIQQQLEDLRKSKTLVFKK